MRKLLLIGLFAAGATPLLAQGAPAPQPMGQQIASMMAKTMTRAEVQTRVQTQFAKRDTNRDGVLTADELAMRGGGKASMVMHHGSPTDGAMRAPQAMRDPNAAFDRLDANRDGAISRDEFARGREVRIERRVVVNQPGQPGAMGMNHGGMRGMHRGGGGMMGAAMFKMADANRDGKVTLAEATAGALRHFDMMDTNRDGRLTPEEHRAGRVHMMQMRRAG